MTYTATGLPLGVTLDPNSGRLSGTLGFGTASVNSYPVSVTATAGSATATQSFSWTVNQLTLQPVAPQANLEGDAVSLSLSPTNPAGQPLTFSLTGQPPGLTIDPSAGVISGIVATGDAGNSPYAVTVIASDGPFSASQTIPWTVSRVLLTAPGDQTNAEGDTVSLPLQATAAPGAGAITYGASNLPPGLTLNSSTGLISGSLANLSSNAGPYAVTVTAMAGGSTSSQSFVWNVTHVLLDNPGDQYGVDGASGALVVAGSDPDSDPLTYTATGLPPGLSITASNGVISGTLSNTASANSPYAVTVTASDGSHTASQTFQWYIDHIALANPGEQINAAGDIVSLPLFASAPGNLPLTYTASGLPPGLTLNPTSGVIGGTVASGAPGRQSVRGHSHGFRRHLQHQPELLLDRQQRSGDAHQSRQPKCCRRLGGGRARQRQRPRRRHVELHRVGSTAGPEHRRGHRVISGTIDLSAATTNSGQYPVTLLANNGTGSTSSLRFTWTVMQANLAPQTVNPGSQSAKEGDAVSLPVYAFDPNGDTLSFTATGLPSGLSIVSTTGVIAGTVAAALPTAARTRSRSRPPTAR